MSDNDIMDEMRRIDENLRRMESRLTDAERRAAIDLVRANGWGIGSQPPHYVWMMAYQEQIHARQFPRTRPPMIGAGRYHKPIDPDPFGLRGLF